MPAKIILIAQAPSRGGDPAVPFSGPAGRRLAALAGLDLPSFLKMFERRNLLPAWPGHESKGDRFPLAEGRVAADAMRDEVEGRKCVLVGRNVAASFRLVKEEDYEWFAPIEMEPGIEVAVVPHPSGISHWWNDPENVERAREFMARLKLGMLAPKKRSARKDGRGGRTEQFSVEQVKAALEAGRGVYSWAAEYLAEETGTSCVAQTIKNYIDRYPDQLGHVGKIQLIKLAGKATSNIVRAIEAGSVEDSWKFWQTTPAKMIAAELGANMTREISARVDGRVEHDVAVRVVVEDMRQELLIEAERHATLLIDDQRPRGNGANGSAD